jgi:DNA replicative helicase MCM subunit Mcm2 (Cdc46/Mcm family)
MYFTAWNYWVQLRRFKCKRCGEVIEKEVSEQEFDAPPICPNCDRKDQQP